MIFVGCGKCDFVTGEHVLVVVGVCCFLRVVKIIV